MILKKCSRCKKSKDGNDFTKRPTSKDGLYPQCKVCTRELGSTYRKKNPNKTKEWRLKNKEHIKEYSRKYNEDNKEAMVIKKAIYDKKYRDSNRKEIAEKSKIHRSKRVNEKSEYDKKYAEDNKQYIAKRSEKYYLKNKNKIKEYYQEWYKVNKYKAVNNARNYFNKIKRATPTWLDDNHLNEMLLLYKDRQTIELITGVKYHVDHIIPVQGKTVCGLHVPWNLRIITRTENLKKSNKLLLT